MSRLEPELERVAEKVAAILKERRQPIKEPEHDYGHMNRDAEIRRIVRRSLELLELDGLCGCLLCCS